MVCSGLNILYINKECSGFYPNIREIDSLQIPGIDKFALEVLVNILNNRATYVGCLNNITDINFSEYNLIIVHTSPKDIKRISDISKRYNIPLIITTSEDNNEPRERHLLYHDNEGIAIIQKPFTVKNLEDAVNGVVNKLVLYKPSLSRASLLGTK